MKSAERKQHYWNCTKILCTCKKLLFRGLAVAMPDSVSDSSPPCAKVWLKEKKNEAVNEHRKLFLLDLLIHPLSSFFPTAGWGCVTTKGTLPSAHERAKLWEPWLVLRQVLSTINVFNVGPSPLTITSCYFQTPNQTKKPQQKRMMDIEFFKIHSFFWALRPEIGWANICISENYF